MTFKKIKIKEVKIKKKKKSRCKLGKERGEPLQYRRKNKGAAQWAATNSAVREVR